MPKRIQRKRTKGWKMPAGAVYVGRPTKWGNPYKIGSEYEWMNWVTGAWENPASSNTPPQPWLAKIYRVSIVLHGCAGTSRRTVTKADERRAAPRPSPAGATCRFEGQPVPCHADVLLEVANR